ncbi:MAG: sulfotransferase family protein [Phycisphaerales bacterium JB043]
MLDLLKPYARAWKYGRLYRRARALAQRGVRWDPDAWHAPPVFVVGCGRSGTTILGELLSRHPGVRYLFEPYHAWAAIDARTDMTNLYTSQQPMCFMEESDCTLEARARFEGVFGEHLRDPKQRLIEKTPIHALRIPYLSSVAPGARFVHIRRRCEPVANSIERLATGNTYKIFGKKTLNQWWGVDDVKWRVLIEQGERLGAGVSSISSDTGDHWQRGVYEWYCTEWFLSRCLERDAALSDRLLQVTYEDFLSRPGDTLDTIARFCDIEDDPGWSERAASAVSARTHAGTPSRQLPTVVRELEQRLYSDSSGSVCA